MTLAQDYRTHVAIHLNRPLTSKERRTVDQMRRDGDKFEAIVEYIKSQEVTHSPLMTHEQFEARLRFDVDFSDAYDDYAHYCHVYAALEAK